MPPSTEPKREIVLATVATRLDTIAAGTDYWFTPQVVRDPLPLRQYQEALDAGETVLGVIPIDGSDLVPDEKPSGFLVAYRFVVVGYVKTLTPTVPVSRLMERLWRDHVVALMVDPTLGQLVIDCIPDGPRGTDSSAGVPEAEFQQPWLATFIERF